jgi:murein DD-endopeptidase MepM/ murein hydrolase activator NlpD
MQESRLTNLGHLGPDNDHDSLGLFQQRPSQGWGRPDQILDPGYAATQFFRRLLQVPRWQDLSITEGAQAVQRSAYPDAYARWEGDAVVVVSHVTGLSIDMLAACGAVGSWTQPVYAPIVSGFRSSERPGHDGVDLGAARGTPIRAASTGTVTVARCDNDPQLPYRCVTDGSPRTPGCGWYMDIEHGGDVVTRYCHMLSRPVVVEGQHVRTGQVIGIVGSSGHSSGPHLHYEVHLGDHTASTAIDPVPFMSGVGAPLGRP